MATAAAAPSVTSDGPAALLRRTADTSAGSTVVGQWFERGGGLDLFAGHPAEQAGQAGELGDRATAALAARQVALELEPLGRRQRAEDVGGVGVRERAVGHAATPISSRASRSARSA